MNVSTQSTIHKRMKCFVAFIAPEPEKRDDIKRQADDIRNSIERQAKEDGYTILSSPNSGSFAKKTGLRRHLQGDSEVEGQDIDIAFILRDEDADGEPLGCLVDEFEGYLRNTWPQSDVGQTKSSATISFSGSRNRFDAVPLIATKRDNIQRLIRTNGEERQSSVKKQTEFMKKRQRSSDALSGVVKFNECVRLIKWWRYQRQSESDIFGNGPNDTKAPSFLFDLLCAKAYDKVSVNKTYPETLARWFSYLAHAVRNREEILFHDFRANHQERADAQWKVIDPMDDTNNVVKNWPDYKIDELAEWFEDARDWMAQAIRHYHEGDDRASMNYLVKLLGNPIKTHCNDQR